MSERQEEKTTGFFIKEEKDLRGVFTSNQVLAFSKINVILKF